MSLGWALAVRGLEAGLLCPGVFCNLRRQGRLWVQRIGPPAPPLTFVTRHSSTLPPPPPPRARFQGATATTPHSACVRLTAAWPRLGLGLGLGAPACGVSVLDVKEGPAEAAELNV